MATWLDTGTSYTIHSTIGTVPGCYVVIGYSNVNRNGSQFSCDFGIRIQKRDSSNASVARQPLAIRYPNNNSGEVRYAKGYIAMELGRYYYAGGTTPSTNTSESIVFSYQADVGTSAGNANITVGVTFIPNGANPNTAQWTPITLTIPYNASFTTPYFTDFAANSVPPVGYVNIPYPYNVYLACNYGSSTANNNLCWYGSLTGGTRIFKPINAGSTFGGTQRTISFVSNADIGQWQFRGRIDYTNANGSPSYLYHPSIYYVTVSFLNPTINAVTNALNKTDFYRTSTVESTSTATVTSNSAAPTIYTYFSDTDDAVGDGSGAGFYKITTYGVNSTNTFNSEVKSYTHPGNKPGTFYSQLSLRGNNGSDTWTEFETAGQVFYTMHEFVVPTAERTLTYDMNNVYVGQTKFPVTLEINSATKSEYDTLTPDLQTYIYKDNEKQTSASVSNSFETGTTTKTLNNSSVSQVLNDTISFGSDFTYKDIDNNDVTTAVYSDEYTVKEMPAPADGEVNVELNTNGGVSIHFNFDSDFVCNWTVYTESPDGTETYGTNTGIGIYPHGGSSFSVSENAKNAESYRARIVCYYSLKDEPNVYGASSTFYSNTIYNSEVIKLNVKSGNDTSTFYLTDSNKCAKPRLVIKSNDKVYYLPLTEYTLDSPSTYKRLFVKNGSTVYYALEGQRPGATPLTNEQLKAYTHEALSAYKNEQITTGEM